MKPEPLFLDLETFSECDLKVEGAYRFAKHPSTRIELFGWAIGPDMIPEVWDVKEEPAPVKLIHALLDPERIKVAHHTQFDRNVIHECLHRMNVTEWEDTMVIAYTLALPGALEQTLRALGADVDYQKVGDGKRLVRMFCKPQKVTKNQPFIIRDRSTDPEDWEKYIEYCRQDVNSMRWAYYKMPQWVISRAGRTEAQRQMALWHLSERINDRGMPIDLDLAHSAIKLTENALDDLNAELHSLTNGTVDAHSKRDSMLAWIQSQGVSMKGYTKEDLKDKLKEDLPPKVRRALEIRQEAGRTSIAKYQALIDKTDDDGRLRGGIQYYGAKRTGRYAGRGFQPQNLSHPEVKDTDAAAESILNNTTDLLFDESAMAVAVSCVRSCIKAPPGKQLMVSDLSNIEGRILPWLAGEEWKLQAFRDYDAGTGHDLYKVAYHKSFGTPFEDIGKDERQIGKFQELSLGYQGGVGAFYKQAKKFGTDMNDIYNQVVGLATDEMVASAEWMVDWIRENRSDMNEVSDEGIIGADLVKQSWRMANEDICKYWYKLEDMVRRAIENQAAGQAFRAGLIQAAVRDDKLLIMLPSKRPLVYNRPKITKDGNIIYMNHDKGRWNAVALYGGKIAENVTQGTAADVLTWNMPAIDKEFPIIGTVHDEDICEVNTPDQERLNAMMSINPPWADGLPLSADGYISQRYKKD